MRSRYDKYADWYSSLVDAGLPIHGIARRSLTHVMGPVAGQRICDLACGEGFFSRELVSLGAQVVGVDLSLDLLGIARRKSMESRPAAGGHLGLLQADAEHLGCLKACSFDGVTCVLALMDLPEHAKVVQEARRILKPGGFFAFCVLHPCFHGPRQADEKGVRPIAVRYFQEGPWYSRNPHGMRGQLGSFHRTVSSYLGALIDTGFRLTHFEEPRPEPAEAECPPIHFEVPAILTVRSVKK